jgi:PAS domain S-box-containing protein
MNLSAHTHNDLLFLEGGGEMGDIILNHQWKETGIGALPEWPKSLRTTLGVMLHSAFPMFLFWGPELICFYNDAFRPSLGVDGKHPAIGKKGIEVWPEIWTFIGPLIERVMSSGKAVYFEDQLVPFYRNGRMEDIYWTFSYSPAYGDEGSINGVFVTCTETTQKIHTAKMLENSLQNLHNIILQAPVAMCIFKGPDFVVDIANDRMCELWGVPREQVMQRPIFKAIPEISRQGFEELLAGVYDTGETFSASAVPVNVPRSAETRTIYVNFVYEAYREPAGLITGVMVVASEVTEQVDERSRQLMQMNETIRKSEERYHLMVGEVQDYAILFLNNKGIVENWNKGAEQIKGYKAEEIIGKNFSIFYTEPDRKRHLPEQLLRTAALEGRASHEGWRVRKDGTLFWGSIVITSLRDESGQILGFSKVTRDLTEKKAAEERLKSNARQLQQKNTELEKMNAELGSFAYVSSHDLQEPLRKIQTFASLILEKEKKNLSESGQDYFSRIQQAANRMQLLIEDLLSYSRTGSSEQIFEYRDLNAIFDEVKDELQESLDEKKAVLETNGACNVNIIPFQFRQMMLNLVGNALKFSRPGVPPRITLESEIVKGDATGNVLLSKPKKYCHISISDNGIGFDPQYSERIFEVFQRLHAKETYQGTGIGLSIVKKIVDNHGGIIKATGVLGEGARFDIYLPASA